MNLVQGIKSGEGLVSRGGVIDQLVELLLYENVIVCKGVELLANGSIIVLLFSQGIKLLAESCIVVLELRKKINLLSQLCVVVLVLDDLVELLTDLRVIVLE